LETKICKGCGEEKNLEDFHKDKNTKDGYKAMCKECRKIETSEYCFKNREVIREKVKKYRENNKGYIEINKKYREKNREFVFKLKKEWSESEKGRESRRRYYQENTENIKQKVKIYCDKNSEKIKTQRRKMRETDEYKLWMSRYRKIHRKTHPHIYAWRSLLRNTITRLGTKKETQTIKLLGYSATILKEHIENLFTEGMTWENYGKWHIDHIKPVSSFDKNEKVSVVCSLENLQPLWALDNLRKLNKY
jgi:hypothetical protein